MRHLRGSPGNPKSMNFQNNKEAKFMENLRDYVTMNYRIKLFYWLFGNLTCLITLNLIWVILNFCSDPNF